MQKIVSKQGNEVAFKFTNTEKLNIKQYEKWLILDSNDTNAQIISRGSHRKKTRTDIM